MDVFYNELSNRPLATNKEEAKGRILTLLETLKSLWDFDINIMRTHDGFYAELLSDDYSFSSFFGDSTVNIDLKILLKTVVANPYIEDDDSYEADLFISNTFNTQNQNDETVNPEGLASAFVFNSPVISISSHPHWKRNLLSLNITTNETPPAIKNENVLNLHSSDCINYDAFLRWISYLNPIIPLNSEENIYKVFSAPQYQFDIQAINDIISWYYDDKRFLIRVKELIEDIVQNPFTGGKGKTETLGGTGGKASKRIIKKDRIIYTYTNDKIIIHQCRGHYDEN